MDDFYRLRLLWEAFAQLVGTGAATLAGLMFVAMSLSRALVTRDNLPVVRAYTDPALLAFVLSFLIGAVLLMPTLSARTLGAFLLMGGTLGLVYTLMILRQFFRTQQTQTWDGSDWVWFAVAPLTSGVLLLLAGVLAGGTQAGLALSLTGFTTLLLLVMGIRNAWDLVAFTVAHVSRAADDAAPGEP